MAKVTEKVIERNRANALKKFIDLTNKTFDRLTVIKRVIVYRS